MSALTNIHTHTHKNTDPQQLGHTNIWSVLKLNPLAASTVASVVNVEALPIPLIASVKPKHQTRNFSSPFPVCNMCEREGDDADVAVRAQSGVPPVLREDHPDGSQPTPAAAAVRHLSSEDLATAASTEACYQQELAGKKK